MNLINVTERISYYPFERERASTKYVAGGNPQPRNGKVIGHIIIAIQIISKTQSTT